LEHESVKINYQCKGKHICNGIVEALVSLRVISLFALDARNRLFERGDAGWLS